MTMKCIPAMSAVMLVALLGFCVSIYHQKGRAVEMDTSGMSQDATNIMYHIDFTDLSSERLEIRGWALVPGETIMEYDMHVVLRENKAGGACYQLPTQSVIRRDVTRLLADSTHSEENPNYDLAGFASVVWLNRLKHLTTTTYSICLAYRNNDHDVLVQTPEMVTLDRGDERGARQ